jgi:hypothetical protein
MYAAILAPWPLDHPPPARTHLDAPPQLGVCIRRRARRIEQGVGPAEAAPQVVVEKVVLQEGGEAEGRVLVREVPPLPVQGAATKQLACRVVCVMQNGRDRGKVRGRRGERVRGRGVEERRKRLAHWRRRWGRGRGGNGRHFSHNPAGCSAHT